jgi:hypothetical protein
MRILLLLSALALPAREPVVASIASPTAARVSVRADSDSVVMAKIMSDMVAAMAEVARRNGFDQTTHRSCWLVLSFL